MALIDSLRSLLGGGWHVNSDGFLGGLLPAVDGTVEANKVVTADANGAVTGISIASGATAAEINRAADVSARIVAVTTTPLTAALATHEGKTVTLALATGIAVTLPAASGSGARYKFVIATANSSTNTYTIATAPTTDIFQGSIYAGTDNGSGAGLTWPAASNSNLLTLGGTSHATGGSVGDTIEVEDIAAGVWAVQGHITQGGTEATPYSHV